MDDFLLLAEFIIQEYPDIVNFEAQMKYLPSNGMVSTYGEAPKWHLDKRRITECLALRGLNDTQKRKKKAVETAKISTLRGYDNGLERMEVIYLRYWCEGGGMDVLDVVRKTGLSYFEVKDYIHDFLALVSDKYGIHPCLGCVFRRELMPGVMACHYAHDMGKLKVTNAMTNTCLVKTDDSTVLEQAWWHPSQQSKVNYDMIRKRPS